jgi:hypothetical protein
MIYFHVTLGTSLFKNILENCKISASSKIGKFIFVKIFKILFIYQFIINWSYLFFWTVDLPGDYLKEFLLPITSLISSVFHFLIISMIEELKNYTIFWFIRTSMIDCKLFTNLHNDLSSYCPLPDRHHLAIELDDALYSHILYKNIHL